MSYKLEIFECQQCGDCCKGYGGTFVTMDDIAAISAFIGTDRKTFVETYCRKSGNERVLAQGSNDYCVFWKDRLCSIHPVKPRMCKAWPFIESVITDVGNWAIMASMCPGIRTDASDEAVLEYVKTRLRASH